MAEVSCRRLSNAVHCMGQKQNHLRRHSVCLCVCAGFGVECLKKQMDIEPGFQWTTNRKWHTANRMVTWLMTPRDRERRRSWPLYVWIQSGKRLDMPIRLQWSIYRKWHLRYQMVTWPMASRGATDSVFIRTLFLFIIFLSHKSMTLIVHFVNIN